MQRALLLYRQSFMCLSGGLPILPPCRKHKAALLAPFRAGTPLLPFLNFFFFKNFARMIVCSWYVAWHLGCWVIDAHPVITPAFMAPTCAWWGSWPPTEFVLTVMLRASQLSLNQEGRLLSLFHRWGFWGLMSEGDSPCCVLAMLDVTLSSPPALALVSLV